ncbi:class II aldolase/adducin family protein [Streptosporangiaceae bacterium NEAU-GS5]|nr:class II aldolase/adducin family protein [Streptosporangiaceae bacterium NEAU-GS5]
MEREREELAAAGRRLAAGGLVIGTAGNLSVRAGDHVAVTPTGGVISELTAAMMTVIDLDGEVVDGELAPTSEVPMHLAIYRATGAGAIAHTHALASTAIACTLPEIPLVHYAMLSLGGELRVAPYATYGTDELAANVVAALAGRQAALMQNHGSIAIGATVAKSVENLELTEWSAELYARCLAVGAPRVLGQAEQEAVIMQALTGGYGTTKKL